MWPLTRLVFTIVTGYIAILLLESPANTQNLNVYQYLSNSCPGFVGTMMFDCYQNGSICIPLQQRMDCMKQCPNGVDEICNINQTRCDMCKCVNGSSEPVVQTNCMDYVPNGCSKPGWFRCPWTTLCLPQTGLLNGTCECPLCEDEDWTFHNACSLGRASCPSASLCRFSQGANYSCDCPDGFYKMGSKCLIDVGTRIPGSCGFNNGKSPVSFQCGDGSCIPMSKFHDCVVDCKDGSDEACFPGQVQCDTCKCVSLSLVPTVCLDRITDKICQLEGTKVAIGMNYSIYHCPNSKRCIMENWLMDGVCDCENCTDEDACIQEPTFCPSTATCNDPYKNGSGIHVCTCKPGYTGDGMSSCTRMVIAAQPAPAATTTTAVPTTTTVAPTTTTMTATTTTLAPTTPVDPTTTRAPTTTTLAPTSTTLAPTITTLASTTTTLAPTTTVAPTTTTVAPITTTLAPTTTTLAPTTTTRFVQITVAAPAAATAGPSCSKWTYMGCYNDNTTRLFTANAYSQSQKMTVDMCQDNCGNRGFSMAGLESSSDCYCSSCFSWSPLATSESSCIMLCSGNTAQKCGGPFTLSVYACVPANGIVPTQVGGCWGNSAAATSATTMVTTTTIATTTNAPLLPPAATITGNNCFGAWQYQGCFQDGATTKLFATDYQTNYIVDAGMTIASCLAFCGTRGYPLAGTEIGNTCMCSRCYTMNPVSLNTCTSPCSGNRSTACGGQSMLTVYGCVPTNGNAVTQVGGCINYDPTTTTVAPTPPRAGISGSGTGSGTQTETGIGTGSGTLTTGNPATLSAGNCAGTWTYQGCYTDSATSRLLAEHAQINYNVDGLTLEQCATFCGLRGFSLSGTESSSDCWCGNCYTTTPTTGMFSCQMPCSGNMGQICGGPFLLSTYACVPPNGVVPKSVCSATSNGSSAPIAG